MVAAPVKVLGETKVMVQPLSRWIDRLPVKLSFTVLAAPAPAKRKVAGVTELLVMIPAM